jgi:hypothetical protein
MRIEVRNLLKRSVSRALRAFLGARKERDRKGSPISAFSKANFFKSAASEEAAARLFHAMRTTNR